VKISKEELLPVLSQFNPWWRGERFLDLPRWRRAVFPELLTWMSEPPTHRAVLLSGARQIGKTTLFLQTVEALLDQGIVPGNILYATFDHPLLKLAGVELVLEAWREREPQNSGLEYLFFDEAQFIRDWGTWVKHQVDFNKRRRIAFTGSVMPLAKDNQESGVGRWHTLRLTTLTFREYLQLQELSFPKQCVPKLPMINSLRSLFKWTPTQFHRVKEKGNPYVGCFHEYLLRGGFPESAKQENIVKIQRLLREDIIDKVLKRDMTAVFGVRRVLELEQTFLYLCMHDGGLLDMTALCSNLEVKRPTAQNFIELLEAAHLIYRLPPYGYGKKILRARFKIYLADAAIAPAVMLRGKEILEDPAALGKAVETAVFKHIFARYYAQSIRLSYWRGTKNREVDLIAEVGDQVIPFEVKYRSNLEGLKFFKGLTEFCQQKNVTHGYVVTRSMQDFGISPELSGGSRQILKIPAPLLCYWLG